jgi:poly-gamma-glutamate synthesis protein (capsule biosynthesis protein)
MPAGPAIGLLGDVMLGRGVAARLASTFPEELWSPQLRALCASLDLVVCNLECCISTRGEPTRRIPGKPFFFRGPPSAVDALAALGVRAAGLANNHALDFEEDALADTLALLGAAGIATAGAGRGREAARAGAVVSVGDLTVGFVAFTDHPAAYAAGTASWGTAYAPLHREIPAWLCDELARLRACCDLVIAFPHWGPNMQVRPAAWQRARAAELQDAGADLVAGHSAHVFHGVGWTAAGPVLYDLGDAIDDYMIDPVLRNDLGVLAIWRPCAPAGERLELVGLRLELAFTGLAEDEDADWIAARLTDACTRLGTVVERLGEERFRVTPASLSGS